MRTKTCIDCGKQFETRGTYAWRCPECSAVRKRTIHAERNRQKYLEKTGRIGMKKWEHKSFVLVCDVCGKEFAAKQVRKPGKCVCGKCMKQKSWQARAARLRAANAPKIAARKAAAEARRIEKAKAQAARREEIEARRQAKEAEHLAKKAEKTAKYKAYLAQCAERKAAREKEIAARKAAREAERLAKIVKRDREIALIKNRVANAAKVRARFTAEKKADMARANSLCKHEVVKETAETWKPVVVNWSALRTVRMCQHCHNEFTPKGKEWVCPVCASHGKTRHRAELIGERMTTSEVRC